MNYSIDLRKRVVDFVIEKNNRMRKASKVFDVHYNTVKSWRKRFRGRIIPKSHSWETNNQIKPIRIRKTSIRTSRELPIRTRRNVLRQSRNLL